MSWFKMSRFLFFRLITHLKWLILLVKLLFVTLNIILSDSTAQCHSDVITSAAENMSVWNIWIEEEHGFSMFPPFDIKSVVTDWLNLNCCCCCEEEVQMFYSHSLWGSVWLDLNWNCFTKIILINNKIVLNDSCDWSIEIPPSFPLP